MATFTRLAAIGSYLPRTSQSNDELVSQMANPGGVDIEKVTGIAHRRVYDDESSVAMAVHAARDALANAAADPTSIDLIINTSIMRSADGNLYTYEPSLSLLIRNELGATNAIHFDVSNACAGMMTGVMIADRMIRAGTIRRALVVSGEQISVIAEAAVAEITEQYDLQFASLTVGDSAAAVIIDAVDAPDSQRPSGTIEFIDLVLASESAQHCLGMPSDKGPRISLYTDNKKMHNEARFMLLFDWLKDRMSEQGWSVSDLNFTHAIHHQVALMAVAMTEHMWRRELEIDPPPALNILEYLGNTASTSHFVVLHEKLKNGEVTPGDRLAMIPAASGVITGLLAVNTDNIAYQRTSEVSA